MSNDKVLIAPDHGASFYDFCQKIWGREGGQHDQHFVKNEFVKNRVGGSGPTSFWIMSLNILFFSSLGSNLDSESKLCSEEPEWVLNSVLTNT